MLLENFGNNVTNLCKEVADTAMLPQPVDSVLTKKATDIDETALKDTQCSQELILSSHKRQT